jgi:hypothetical protein
MQYICRSLLLQTLIRTFSSLPPTNYIVKSIPSSYSQEHDICYRALLYVAELIILLDTHLVLKLSCIGIAIRFCVYLYQVISRLMILFFLGEERAAVVVGCH